MLTLHIREIGAPLSDGSSPEIAPDTSAQNSFGWLDSSLDLESGLDVLDLSATTRKMGSRNAYG
jgi:hypothetical protein